MAALDFPASPSNGQTYTAANKTWIYDAVAGVWTVQSDGFGGGGGIGIVGGVNARLTLTSGVPVTTSDVIGAPSIYWTSYLGNTVTLWNGSAWQGYTLIEVMIPLGTLIAARPYDIFGYQNNGAPVCELLAWNNDSTRFASGPYSILPPIRDGRYVKSTDGTAVDKTRLYLGTFYTTSTTTTEDSAGGTTTQVGGKRFLWNYYNRIARQAIVVDLTSAGYTYALAAFRQMRGVSGNKIECVIGIAESVCTAQALVQYNPTNGKSGMTGIGVDSTSVNSAQLAGYTYTSGTGGDIGAGQEAEWSGVLAAGYHYICPLESNPSANTITIQGNVTLCKPGLTAIIDSGGAGSGGSSGISSGVGGGSSTSSDASVIFLTQQMFGSI